MSNPTDFPVANYKVTCMTKKCPAVGIEVEITAAAENPVIHCGACGQPVTIQN